MKKSPKLLIGTSNKILLLDTKTEQLDILIEREKRKKWFFFDASSKGFFGITQSGKEEVIAAAREKLGTAKSGKPSTDVILHKISLSSKSSSIGTALDIHDVHQICHYKGKLYLTDTGKNRVVIVEKDSGNTIGLLNVGSARQDINHINAISIEEDTLYVGLNNRGDKEAEILRIPIAQIPEGGCDLLSPELNAEVIVLPDCYHTHDINLDYGRMMFCASHDGNIHYVNQAKPFYTSSDWVRGLASDEERVWVGVSQKAERGKRHSEDLHGEVVEIDKSNGQELRRIHIQGAGQVNDLLLIED